LEDYHLHGNHRKAAVEQFRVDWDQCLDMIEQTLHHTDPLRGDQVFAWYQEIVRAQLDTWFRPEHHRGDWLRNLSNINPEVAATVRQRLTAVQLPSGRYKLTPPHWIGSSSYAAGVAGIVLCFHVLPISPVYSITGIVMVSLLLLVIGLAVWRKECMRRRIRVVVAVREALENEGKAIAAII
jgi:hypothetical protein